MLGRIPIHEAGDTDEDYKRDANKEVLHRLILPENGLVEPSFSGGLAIISYLCYIDFSERNARLFFVVALLKETLMYRGHYEEKLAYYEEVKKGTPTTQPKKAGEDTATPQEGSSAKADQECSGAKSSE